MPSMIYRATDHVFNVERQKWQVACSVFGPNVSNPLTPDPVPDFQGILIDCANSSPTAVKQACVTFCAAVEAAKSTDMESTLGKLIIADTGEIIPTP